MFFQVDQRLLEKTSEQNKQTTCFNFFEIMTSRRSILFQSKMKRSETSITRSHEYFIVFNFWDTWRDSIDKSINDETFLTMFANKKRTKNFWKSKKKRNKWNRSWKNRKLTRNVFANMCWLKCFEFDWFESKCDHCYHESCLNRRIID